MKRTLTLLGLSLALLLGLAASIPAVYLNGARTTEVVVIQGKVYVALEALQKAGAEVSRRPDGWSVQFVPVGGRMRVEAVEGLQDDWLSNGVWRVRASQVAPAPNPFFASRPGYSLRLEFRNLARTPESLLTTGLDKVQLLDAQGNILEAADWTQRYDKIPPGGGAAVVLRFGLRDHNQTPGSPAKLLLLFRPSGGKPALPHFRVALRGP
ncbi:hypothetical protein [Meiothermus rufus]|uniref:hypothetical protein n=1 Tax=Meiothermus rufus TaxID=604332 RepID=UPI00040EE226|nr:hypothetical protein [Meiothermus rufus]